jgi:hypothetical protein
MLTSPRSTVAVLKATRTLFMFTLSDNSTENVKFMELWISFLEMLLLSSRAAIYLLESQWLIKRMPSQPKAGPIQIKTPVLLNHYLF